MSKILIYFNVKICYTYNNTYASDMAIKKHYNLNQLHNPQPSDQFHKPLLINHFNDNGLNFSLLFFSDSLSIPLLILTIWLLPIILIASQHHLSKENLARKKLYISILVLLQLFLVITFTAIELILFYILFEATLVPTLIIITQRGNQTEHLNAGLYLFYTLVCSLPLLGILVYIQNTVGPLNILMLSPINIQLFIQWFHMVSMHNCLNSKIIILWPPPLTT